MARFPAIGNHARPGEDFTWRPSIIHRGLSRRRAGRGAWGMTPVHREATRQAGTSCCRRGVNRTIRKGSTALGRSGAVAAFENQYWIRHMEKVVPHDTLHAGEHLSRQLFVGVLFPNELSAVSFHQKSRE